MPYGPSQREEAAHPDIPVVQTYGYITNWNRNKHGFGKSHVNDAFCIAENVEASRADTIYDILKVRCHNRHLEKDNFKKNGKKQRHQGPRFVKGYQLYSKCRYDGKDAIVTARKSDGRLNLLHSDGSTSKYVPIRKTMLVEHAKTRIYTRKMPHSAPMQA